MKRAGTLLTVVVLLLATSCGADDPTAPVTTSTTAAPTTTTPVITTTTTTVAPTPTTQPPPLTTTTSTTTTTTTTTVPPDTEPPLLVVTDPVSGSTVTTKVYRFRGRTEPGAEVVAAGRYAVPVDSAGNWFIDLVFKLGGNATQFTATDAAGNTTTTRVAVTYMPGLVLRTDGLGIVAFGTPADETVAALTAALGKPHGSIQPSARLHLRPINWERYGLVVWVSTSPFYRSDGIEHFAGYDVWEGDVAFRTPAGIGIGSTAIDLRAAYGDAVDFSAEKDEGCTGHWLYWTEDETPDDARLDRYFGYLSGSGATSGSRVLMIRAGAGLVC